MSPSKLVIFIDLNLDIFVLYHLPTIVVFDKESLSDDIFDSVFEDKRIPYFLCFLVGAIHIEQIVR